MTYQQELIKILAVPVFGLIILAEYWIGLLKKKKVYTFSNTVSNLSIGIAERMLDILYGSVAWVVISYVYENFAVAHIPAHIFTWLLLFVLVDFLWYWYHRIGHEVYLFWCFHVVHHQSEEYNFSVAARITVLQSFVRLIFWSLLPLAGFSPAMVMPVILIQGVYQFFIHTSLVGKLGFLENILVTPSHHRVHHASNEAYLDKNYGGVLIIWDRLFGTFCPETEQPKYGLTKPMKTKSFLWVHFHALLEMFALMEQAKGLRSALQLMFGKPVGLSIAQKRKLEAQFLTVKKRGRLNKRLKRYIVIQVALAFVALAILLGGRHVYSTFLLCNVGLFVLFTVVIVCAMLEQKQYVTFIEVLRLETVLIGCIYIEALPAALFLIVNLAIVALQTNNWLPQWYFRWVTGENKEDKEYTNNNISSL